MKPAQVLDYQQALRDALRTGYYRNYLDGFLESMIIKGGGRGGHVKNRGVTFADSEIRVLEAAYAFHVDAEMMPLIRHASTGLDEEVLWEKEVFPTDRGFLMFDDGLVGRDLRQQNMVTSAITWHWGAGPNGRQAGVWLSLYSRWEDPRDDVAVSLRAKVGDEMLRGLGPLHINHVQFVPWGHSLGAARQTVGAAEAANYAIAGDPVEVGIEFDNPLRGIYTTLALMGQTITDVTDEEISPHLKRHLGKKRIPARVVVITLRRTAGSHQPGESLVEWAHRWVVRAYWRKQRYGVGNTKVRVILIAPYIKGPADKPLVISSKVYDLSR